MTNGNTIQENKIKKINQIKSYLDDLNSKLKETIKESRFKMQEIASKKDEKEIKKLLEELKKM